MPQNLATFNAAKLLTLSAAGSAASAASLGVQLNQPHAFFYLQMPFWFFIIAMVVLTFLGALLSLTTDYMRSRGTTAEKLTTAVVVGLVISFVVLPTLITEPSVGLLMVTAFFGGLSGTILTYITLRLLNNKELQDAVIDLIAQRFVKFLGVILDLMTEHATKLATVVLTTIVASFVVVPQLRTELDVRSAMDIQGVLHDRHC